MYCNDRADGYSGVLIGVKSNNFITSDLLDISPHLEVCTVLLHLTKSTNLLLFCVDRSPNTDVTYQASLCNYIITMTKKYPNANICCTGDFNLPDIDWDSESIHSHRYPLAVNDLMLNMSVECGFTQVVNFPTREKNTLDLFFTTYPSCIQQCEPIPGISDHDIILTTVKSNISYSKSANHNVYLWRNANLQDMSEDILNFSLDFTYTHTIDTPIEELWSKL